MTLRTWILAIVAALSTWCVSARREASIPDGPAVCDEEEEENPLAGVADAELVGIDVALRPIFGSALTQGDLKRMRAVTRRRDRGYAEMTADKEDLYVALALYTWNKLYRALNAALWEAAATKCSAAARKYFPFLRLLFEALDELAPPDEGGRRVYRGTTIEVPVLEGNYKVGQLVTWWGFSSCSVGRAEAENFAKWTFIDKRQRYANLGIEIKEVMMSIDVRHGHDLQAFGVPEEREVLLKPGTVLRVTSVKEESARRVAIGLEEVGSVWTGVSDELE